MLRRTTKKLLDHSSMMNPRVGKPAPTVYNTAAEAVAPFIRPDLKQFYLHMGAATPTRLIEGVCANADRVEGEISFLHMSLAGPLAHLDDKYEGKFKSKAMFVSENVRKSVNSGRSDFIPIFFSEIPSAIREGTLPVDVALIHVSPPDAHGWCSMGVSVDCSLAAAQSAKYVIAQINPQMPRTHGDSLIHYNTFDAVINVDDPIPVSKQGELSAVDVAIGKHCASLIPDGATLQMGIGNIPNAVLASLTGHKDLGVHTELFSDGVLPLMESGVINNRMKKIYPHRTVGTFLTGTKNLWDFVHDNPAVCMLDVSNVNNPAIIGMNPAVHAINSAIEVDLTGQVCADSIGTRVYSGIGGQMDFMRGAALSRGGKPIIALPSLTNKGESKITPFLKPGAGVVTTRAHVHYVVTEHGIAELYTKTLFQRAVNLANIADPSHRDELFKAIRERFGRQIFPAAKV